MRTGIAQFTLDYGKCPPWLFQRMVRLGRIVSEAIIGEFGPEEFIARLADPVWFQSLGTVLAFDWNASGLTTILTAALKEALRGQEERLGVFICGGKGKTSRKTPEEILSWAQKLNFQNEKSLALVQSSKLTAKVDSCLIQDGFQIYHHAFFFTRRGSWTVVQQGMNTSLQKARRYHWHSAATKNFIEEPHSGITSEVILPKVLNLTAKESEKNRQISLELSRDGILTLKRDLFLIDRYSNHLSKMVEYEVRSSDQSKSWHIKFLNLADGNISWHSVLSEDFKKSAYLEKILEKIYSQKPKTFEELLGIEGVGPKTIRALSLVSEVIYGAPPSYRDPARYSFAHGGKDGTPFPVDRLTYDKTIEILDKAIRSSSLDFKEKEKALRRVYQTPLFQK